MWYGNRIFKCRELSDPRLEVNRSPEPRGVAEPGRHVERPATMRHRPASVLLVAVAAGAIVLVAIDLAQQDRPTPTASRPSASVVPVPTTFAPPSLRADGLATVEPAGGLRVWRSPRLKESEALTPTLPSGAVVFLAGGPRRVDGSEWWEVQPDHVPRTSLPFGWVQATDNLGHPTLAPFVARCPATDQPVDPGVIKALGTLQALSCFGGAEITLQGQVTCWVVIADFAVAGPSWLDSYSSCTLDDALALDGPKVTALLDLQTPRRTITGRYEVRGHFDDPEARTCSWIPFGTTVTSPVGPPDPGAVVVCRQAFVVTEVTTLD